MKWSHGNKEKKEILRLRVSVLMSLLCACDDQPPDHPSCVSSLSFATSLLHGPIYLHAVRLVLVSLSIKSAKEKRDQQCPSAQIFSTHIVPSGLGSPPGTWIFLPQKPGQ